VDQDCQLTPSTHFCLLEEDQYNNVSACVSFPVNSQVLCAVSQTCELMETQSTIVPEASTTASDKETSAANPSSMQMPNLSNSIITSVKTRLDGARPLGLSPQQELRQWLYIGVGVCCLMLVVILALLAGVVVLCRAPVARKQRLTSRGFIRPLNNEVW